MTKELKEILDSNQIRVINPVLSEKGSSNISGWICKYETTLIKNQHIKKLAKQLTKTGLPYYIEDSFDDEKFFIFKEE